MIVERRTETFVQGLSGTLVLLAWDNRQLTELCSGFGIRRPSLDGRENARLTSKGGHRKLASQACRLREV